MFLYNYDDTHENDDEYPASIEQYFNELVERNPSICSETIAALSNLYKIAGMGEFSLD
ncbi:MAG: hypothetical protein Q4C83_01630 [Candidatus Saccharibacteria bacterium]|nr:hypothetical protein [Candidatus Saccharibacteria bacterium]